MQLNITFTDFLSEVFVFDRYGELVALLHQSIFAGAVLGVIGGFVGIFVMMRRHAFAVHAIAEMSFAGAALFLLLGYNVVTGSLVGSIASALLIALMGSKAHENDSVIGALMPLGWDWASFSSPSTQAEPPTNSHC